VNKLKRLIKTVKTEEEFVKVVMAHQFWYLDEPHMKTWTKKKLREVYQEEQPFILGQKIEIERGYNGNI